MRRGYKKKKQEVRRSEETRGGAGTKNETKVEERKEEE